MSLHASPETSARVLAYLDRNPSASLREIGTSLDVGRSTAQRAVFRLLDERRVEVVRKGTGYGYPTRYRVIS